MHVAEKMCIPAKNPNVANRCPLCHTDNTPPGKVGWDVHSNTELSRRWPYCGRPALRWGPGDPIDG